MSDKFFLGAYWSDRAESSERCAERLAVYLKSLQVIHPSFSGWCKKGASKKKAESLQISLDESSLNELLKSGVSKKDIDGDTIHELGFQAGIWNGQSPPKSASISVQCGGFNLAQGLSNSVVVKLPDVASLGVETLVSLAELTVSCWEPEDLTVTSNKLLDAVGSKFEEYLPGWIRYIRAPRTSLTNLKSPVLVRELHGKGELVLLTNEYFSVDNTQHMERAEELSEYLSRGH